MTNFLYNPDRKSKDQLIVEFVVRTDLLEDIMQDIESSTMQTPEQHYLLVGQRGTGKTTLLHRIKYAIEDNSKLNKWLIPVIFSEEQYNISELANLWETVTHNLEDYHGFKGISEEMERHITKNNFEELCYDILEKYLGRHNKKLVLLIDNIGDLLKKLDDKEVRRLREILQTKAHIRLIAGSPFYLDSILDYKQPLFEFFKIIRLDGLTKEETQGLLLKLGEVHNEKEKIERIMNETPERIETLRLLTGGVPRTISLMFNIFIDNEHESSLKDLEKVLDAVTPLYKHRMDDLPTQQQKIVDAVARNWDAISVKELTGKLRIDSKIISAQLRQLEKNQIIEKRETSTKNHIYLLRERFWNIWYLMRYGRKTDSERVVWLVRFLESWCSSKDLESRVDDFVIKVKDGTLDGDTLEFFGSVYSAIKLMPAKAKFILKGNVPGHMAKEIELSDSELVDLIKTDIKEDDFLSSVQKLRMVKKSTDEIKEIINSLFVRASNGNLEPLFKDLTKNIISAIMNDNEGEIAMDVVDYLSFFIFIDALISFAFKAGNYESAQIGLNELIKFLRVNSTVASKFEYGSLGQTLIIFLNHKKYNIVQQVFDSNTDLDLKDKIKPIYYAFVVLQNGPSSDEALKMGDEIKELVSVIVDSILKNQKELSSN